MCLSTRKQHGASLVFVTLILTSLFGFFALAIDVGYLLVVRNQLQNAADAAALSGATYLYPLDGNNQAIAKATSVIQLNKVNNTLLAEGIITLGYWDMDSTSNGFHNSTSIPSTTNGRPAIQVTINKAGNNGVITPFFARVLGINSFSLGATAVAIEGDGAEYTTSNLFPFVITKCTYDKYSFTGQTFTIGSPHDPNYSNCQIGTWSPLSVNNPGNSTASTLIDNASGKTYASPLIYSVGEAIYIETGSKASDYGATNACSMAGDGTCAYVPIVVVCFGSSGSANCDMLPTNGGLQSTPILGFGCLNILSADQGGKTITVKIVSMGSNDKSTCKLAGSGGTGPAYGAYKPAKLVNYSGNTF